MGKPPRLERQLLRTWSKMAAEEMTEALVEAQEVDPERPLMVLVGEVSWIGL